MKKLIAFLLLGLSLSAGAATYYVRLDGNNSNNGLTNSIGGAWRNLSYACAHTTAGDNIVVGAGTFTESSQCVLAPGVSISGQGVTSIIKPGYVGDLNHGLITCTSSAGTSVNGNQSISYLLLDGNSQTGYCGISVWYRNSVEIHHCTIQNFKYRGISYQIGGGFMDQPSYSNSTNNSVHDNIISDNTTNDAGFSEHAEVWWYGQTDFLFYNNTITSTAYPGNMNSFKCAWQTRSKIYNNIFNRTTDDNDGQWNFFTELFFTVGGCEVYGNTFNGCATFDVAT